MTRASRSDSRDTAGGLDRTGRLGEASGPAVARASQPEPRGAFPQLRRNPRAGIRTVPRPVRLTVRNATAARRIGRVRGDPDGGRAGSVSAVCFRRPPRAPGIRSGAAGIDWNTTRRPVRQGGPCRPAAAGQRPPQRPAGRARAADQPPAGSQRRRARRSRRHDRRRRTLGLCQAPVHRARGKHRGGGGPPLRAGASGSASRSQGAPPNFPARVAGRSGFSFPRIRNPRPPPRRGARRSLLPASRRQGPAAIAAPASLGRDPDELQRLEEAFADCSEAIRLDPRNPGPLRRAGRRALRAGPLRGSHRRLRPGDPPRPGQRPGLPQALPGKLRPRPP